MEIERASNTDNVTRLIEDPRLVEAVPDQQVAAIMSEVVCTQVKLASVQAALLARVDSRAEAMAPAAEVFITVAQAAVIMAVDKRWIQRRYNELPFVRRFGPRKIRISESALREWMERQGRKQARLTQVWHR